MNFNRSSFIENLNPFQYSYSLPELFRSFNFSPDAQWQMDYLYLISRVSDRFLSCQGHLFFNQNQVFMTNIDRQTVYIIMLYLNHYISERENGFLKVCFLLCIFKALDWFLLGHKYFMFNGYYSRFRVIYTTLDFTVDSIYLEN